MEDRKESILNTKYKGDDKYGYAIVYITAGNPSLYTLKWLMVTLGFFLIYFAGRMSKKTF